MKFSLIGAVLIVWGIFVAIFVSNFSKIISLPTEHIIKSSHISRKLTIFDLQVSDSPDHLFWFLQISDLHISIFQDKGRIDELKKFCDTTVRIIKPSVVLATGDLTDAKESDNVGSRQFLEEWKIYKNVLNSCKSLETIKWVDVRGNHDNFDVPGVNSERNLFKNFSMRGEPLSYSVTEKAPDGRSFTFIAVDACPEQGLRRPFNFVGLLRGSQVAHLRRLAAANPDSTYLIWFGHYPTSCILSENEGVKSVIGDDERSLVYLCGHLHTLGGMVPNMYTLQRQGFLELELGDWKDNRLYRLLAIDHGLLSFVDLRNGDWPVILVTNPKRNMHASNREPIKNINTSTHIRLLVFSLGEIERVDVKLDDGEWSHCLHVKGPLYVLPWQPDLYNQPVHNLQVFVSDSLGYKKTYTHQFSLDGRNFEYSLLGRIFLMVNISSGSQLLFGIMISLSVIPLCILRYLSLHVKGQKTVFPDVDVKFVRSWIRKLWLVSNIDIFFYPLVVYPLYLTVGPWCIGELIRGHTGVLFAWGTLINGTFLPGAFSYTQGFFQLFFVHGPLILCLSTILDRRLLGSFEPRGKKTLLDKLPHVLMFLLFVSQLYLAYYFWLAYGTMAVLLGPFRTWPVLMVFWTWRESTTISIFKIRYIASPWLRDS